MAGLSRGLGVVVGRLNSHCSPRISFKSPSDLVSTCGLSGVSAGEFGDVLLGYLPKNRERFHEPLSTGAALHARPRSEVV